MTLDIDTAYSLNHDQITLFRQQGFIRLKDVLSANVLQHYGEAITRLTIALNTQHMAMDERTTYEKAFLQVMNLWEHDDVVRKFVFGQTVARIAAELLEVDGVRLYHDQSLYKESGGGITPAHADQYYWPLATDRCVTAWIPLQAVPVEMGPLAFYAGSHHAEYGRDLAISDESEQQITRNMQAGGFPMVEGAFELGEVSFHLGWTFHRAGGNTSSKPRSVMTMIYMDKGMTLKAPSNEMQRNDGKTWCPGAVVGEIINTPKNPIIYSR